MKRFAILALCFAFASDASAQLMKSDSKVKTTLKAGPIGADGKQTVELSLKIDSGWHLYANPVENATILNSQTKITVLGAKNAEVKYPVGTLKVTGDDKYKIYQDDVKIQVSLTRTPGEAVTFKILVSACSDNNACLLPATIVTKVE